MKVGQRHEEGNVVAVVAGKGVVAEAGVVDHCKVGEVGAFWFACSIKKGIKICKYKID